MTILLILIRAYLAITAPTSDDKLSDSEVWWIAVCVHERIGPTGGIPVTEAIPLCTGLARSNARIAVAVSRAQSAILDCEQAVSDACVDSAAPDGSTDCEADELFAACHSSVPVPVDVDDCAVW